ncbi:MAG TPA: hypothetical protein DEP72_04005 [Clostridiales bacterium]|nr:MAG: hypothetical protein A2Y18_04280 [Clostridiales bacterium GWD2_32_19]HCC07310.1 hypothetical protein [Clostridiales bacterium]
MKDYILRPMTLEEVNDLVTEAEGLKDFLPSRAKPDKTIMPLMTKFSKKDYFKIYGYVNAEQKVVAFITIFEENGSIDIGPMYVCKDNRGMKLGFKQVEDVIERYKTRGVKEILTQTWGENQASQGVFAKCGFKIVEIVENDRVNGDSTVKFKLEI